MNPMKALAQAEGHVPRLPPTPSKPHVKHAERRATLKSVVPQRILLEVAKDVTSSTGISLQTMLDAGQRYKMASRARHIVMWKLAQRGYSPPAIGRAMGAHQTSVLYARRKIQRLLDAQ